MKWYAALGAWVAHNPACLGVLRASKTVEVHPLVSYAYFADRDFVQVRAEHGVQKFFVDSGAFSLATGVDDAAYFAWVRRWADQIEIAATPDVIGDPRASFEAALTMCDQAWPFPVLPVFHVGSDVEWLDKIIELSPYIALGGMVPHVKSGDALRGWIDTCFARIGGRCKVHGFGLTSWRLVRDYPWTSVDSSSWVEPRRFGVLKLFDPTAGIFVKISLRSRRALLEHAELLRQYDLEPRDLLLRRRGGGEADMVALLAASVISQHRGIQWLNERNERCSKSPLSPPVA